MKGEPGPSEIQVCAAAAVADGENRIDPCCRRLQSPCLDSIGSSMKERRGGTEKDSRKGGKKKKGAREERK